MRLINADEYCDFLNTYPLEKAQNNFMSFYRDALQKAYEFEVDAEPVRHGKFVGTEYDGYADGYPVYYEWKCSQCGCVFEDDEKPTYKYCPNCGAKMDEEKEND